jgi:hypothetical protein
MPSGDGQAFWDEEIKAPRWKPDPKTITTKYACGHELTTKVEYENAMAYYHDKKKAAIYCDVGFCPECFALNIKAKQKEK